MNALALAAGLLLALTAGALADDTRVDCVDPSGAVRVSVDVAFNADRDGGEVTAVWAQTPHLVLSTRQGENGTEHADTIAFADISFDSLEVGLESYNAGPMTLIVNLVRTAIYAPGDDPETGAVVAGVANIASVGPVTLVCTGW